ncbi:WD-40 repeat-containing protein [Stanieria cyanosphaera PCC 7437]|uniref:WD-40 repeat-containing protein n=1 Tax=Stanieria cyanosphaera (strain ATCC 29371 / PCC 7437) TaxID=111780 RepID=K9XPE0_STAC7|nr:NB-ARC domain-containing protein [Stanieria cyanosphaera]AFZ33959.1 WD-40 repeat-containing protein [Stanieria cyanosphaera PCC 7437]
MTSERKSEEPEFIAAADYWQLEKLYLDLADIKGRGLTPLEKKFLQGLLCGYSPAEIAEQVYQNRSSSSVRVYLSNGLYKYIQGLFAHNGKEIKIFNWSNITNLLEQAGYKKTTSATNCRERFTSIQENVSARIDLTNFVGREFELNQLKSWIVTRHCRLVAVLGMGGLGKTWLAAKLVEQLQSNFEHIIWFSLATNVSTADFLEGLIKSLLNRVDQELKSQPSDPISFILEFLHSYRCLLILDQFESAFLHGKLAGLYDCQETIYGELLHRLATENHPSCCLIVSREKPQEITCWEAENGRVQSLYLSGLNTQSALKLVSLQDVSGSYLEKEYFVNLYANNPLAINSVALTIKNLFQGNLTEFLATNVRLVSNIRDLLEEHLNRLCEEEKKLVDAIAVNEQLKQLRGIGKEINFNFSMSKQLEVVESLQRRSLIKLNSLQFCQESLLRPYLLEKLIERVESNLLDRELFLLVQHILAEALLRNHNLHRT